MNIIPLRTIWAFSVFAVIFMLSAAVFAKEDSSRDEGLFSEGSFLSEAVSSVTDKLDNVASGEDRIVDDNAKGMDANILEYDRDPLGRSKAALVNDDYRNYRKKMRREQEQKDREQQAI